jgi:osmoprotectant transport system permease protein
VNYFQQGFLWLNDPLNWTNPGGVLDQLRDHLFISVLALVFAALVGLAVGIWFGHTRRGGGFVVAISNMTRAVPTIALLTIFTVETKQFGAPSVVPALAIFAVPPILANAHLGIRSVDPAALDAARGMGLGGWQRLWRVEIPMAVPQIFTGLRTAAVQIVATVTLATLVLGGGLGNTINAGLGLGLVQGGGQIVAGGIIVATLAIIVNLIMYWLGRLATPRGLRRANAQAR